MLQSLTPSQHAPGLRTFLQRVVNLVLYRSLAPDALVMSTTKGEGYGDCHCSTNMRTAPMRAVTEVTHLYERKHTPLNMHTGSFCLSYLEGTAVVCV
jgi:hypothetical protein